VANGPGDHVAAARERTLAPGGGAQHGGDVPGDGRLLGDDGDAHGPPHGPITPSYTHGLTSVGSGKMRPMSSPPHVFGPTFAEMRDPQQVDARTRERARAARTDRPLDPVNLFNLTWK